MKPHEIFSTIYDVLVTHAGANPKSKDEFIEGCLQTKFPMTEWRFQGNLGFGGKFYRNSSGHRVGYYLEDKTPDREAIVEKVNKLLESIPHWYP